MIGILSSQEIADFLTLYDYGRIACAHENKLYIVPVSYKFLGDHFLIHSRGGKKLSMLRANPCLCFQVDHVIDYTHWHSVIAWGNYEEIKSHDELEGVKNIFGDPGLTIKASIPSAASKPNGCEQPAECKELVYYKIAITEMSGRYEYGNGK
jgi:nitroimidazol reductase NimA-like FMN-containing flavoprotein (pyridoxamine 5'-phosphate oxidase superfamily)